MNIVQLYLNMFGITNIQRICTMFIIILGILSPKIYTQKNLTSSNLPFIHLKNHLFYHLYSHLLFPKTQFLSPGVH